MAIAHNSVGEKVAAIFHKMAGRRARALDGAFYNRNVQNWLFPKRFTREEIEAGVIQLLVHAPHHVIAAARLGGHPVEDILAETKSSRRSLKVGKQSRRPQRT